MGQIMRDDPLEPSMTLSLGKSIEIVKFHLDKLDFSVPMKTLAIEKVARMETHNSLTKDDLVKCLRFLFDYYDF